MDWKKKLEDTGIFKKPEPDENKVSASDGSIFGTREVNELSPAQKSPRSSVAAMLLERRTSTETSTTTPAVMAPSPSARMTTPSVADQAIPDPEVVGYFRNAADKSQAPGYGEFFRQMNVLRKHIPDEGALYAAALDLSGGNVDTILQAIEDRLGLVQTERRESLQAFAAQKREEISTNQERMQQIASAIKQCETEILERQGTIKNLDYEKSQVAKKLAETESAYRRDEGVASVAADQVLKELTAQKEQLWRLKKGGQ